MQRGKPSREVSKRSNTTNKQEGNVFEAYRCVPKCTMPHIHTQTLSTTLPKRVVKQSEMEAQISNPRTTALRVSPDVSERHKTSRNLSIVIMAYFLFFFSLPSGDAKWQGYGRTFRFDCDNASSRGRMLSGRFRCRIKPCLPRYACLICSFRLFSAFDYPYLYLQLRDICYYRAQTAPHIHYGVSYFPISRGSPKHRLYGW